MYDQRQAMEREAVKHQEGFPGRLGLQQRVLPAYRTGLMDRLAAACQGGLSVFAGQAGQEEAISGGEELELAQYVRANNLQLVPAASPLYVLWQTNLHKWLVDWDPHVLVLEANARYLSNRTAIRWMKSRGRPVIGWGLGAPAVAGKSPLARVISALINRSRRKYLLSCDALVSYSRKGAAEYRRLGFPSENIFVAPNAVAAKPENPPPRRERGFSGRPVLLFVGRLQERKRIDNLLLACSTFPVDQRPQVNIVGDGPALQQLQQLAEAIYPQAEFFGALRGQELIPLFTAADLFVLPGTGGLAVQEAMAYGLPVVVAEGDGTQNDLVRPENGWLVAPDDREALKTAIRQAVSDPARLRKMGEESFRIVSQEVNLETMVAVFLRVLWKVFNK
jgi:glycosyltransferase involved in cell wall biosynthesis